MPGTPHTEAFDKDAEFQASLTPHPSSNGAVAKEVTASVRASRSRVALTYSLHYEPGLVAIPEQKTSTRQDELWRHTCFEAFVSDGKGYLEFNFSPSTEWAAYHFSQYRTGMAQLKLATPEIRIQSAPRQFDLCADIRLEEDLPISSPPWRLGLSAVVESVAGKKSYWALAHPDGDPDFHHASCFALQIPGTSHL